MWTKHPVALEAAASLTVSAEDTVGAAKASVVLAAAIAVRASTMVTGRQVPAATQTAAGGGPPSKRSSTSDNSSRRKNRKEHAKRCSDSSSSSEGGYYVQTAVQTSNMAANGQPKLTGLSPKDVKDFFAAELHHIDRARGIADLALLEAASGKLHPKWHRLQGGLRATGQNRNKNPVS